METIHLLAPAKVNLDLLVGPRRADGYHPLDSRVVAVTLYDEITLRRRDDGTIRLACEGLPCGPAEKNLAYRAAVLLSEGQPGRGAEIFLRKRIPPGAGLAGGSSDAATVLAGLNDLWQLGLSRRALQAAGARLGSDVPLFLHPPPCRMTGRGEILEPLTVHSFRAVLILPPLTCSTVEVYRAFDARPSPPPVEPLPAALFTQPPSLWRHRLVNHLAEAAFAVCPALGEFHRLLTAALPLPVHLTGSGSGLFVLCDDEEEARRIIQALPREARDFCRLVGQNSWTPPGNSEKMSAGQT